MSHAVLSHAAAVFAAPQASVAPVPGTPAVEVSRSGAVAADLPCRRCDANLRGLPVHSRCRQCGAFVGVSLYGGLLKYGHPDWVRGLSRGARAELQSVALAVIAALVGATLGGRWGAWATGSADAVAAVAAWLAAWQLTSPDPSGQIEVVLPARRRLIRTTLTAALAANLAPAAAWIAPLSPWAAWLPAAALAAALAGFAGQMLLFDQLGQLALRVPAAAMARRARLLRWGYCGAIAANALLAALPARGGGLGTVFAYSTIVTLLATLAYGVMCVALLSRLRRALAIQADYALGISARSMAPAP